jgi:hypothetical protein
MTIIPQLASPQLNSPVQKKKLTAWLSLHDFSWAALPFMHPKRRFVLRSSYQSPTASICVLCV